MLLSRLHYSEWVNLKLCAWTVLKKLDEKMQKQVIDICEQNDIQAFMTVTEFTGDEQFTIENAFKEE